MAAIDPLSLDELATAINSEHRATLESLSDAVAHAVSAGEALLRARRIVPLDEWTNWVEQNVECSYGHAMRYVRLASFKDVVQDAPTLSAALRSLNGSGLERKRGVPPSFDHGQAIALRESGWSIRAIAEISGVSITAVQGAVLDKDVRKRSRQREIERNRKRAAAKVALERQRRAESAARVGGGVNDAFKRIRAAQQSLSNLSETGSTTEIRQAATLAYRALGRAEDEIAKVLVDGEAKP